MTQKTRDRGRARDQQTRLAGDLAGLALAARVVAQSRGREGTGQGETWDEKWETGRDGCPVRNCMLADARFSGPENGATPT